jgi:hypothetical protein
MPLEVGKPLHLGFDLPPDSKEISYLTQHKVQDTLTDERQ